MGSARSVKTKNQIKKYDQTQNSKKSENRELSESRLLRKDNQKPNPKSNEGVGVEIWNEQT